MQIVNGIVLNVEGIRIIQHLIPISNKNARPGYAMNAECFAVHNTGNPGASAKANSEYVDNQTGYVSWHFTVGNCEVYQELPITESGWHAGDGANGPGNRKSIGIEIAEVPGAEETAIKFIAELLKATGLGIDRVLPHKHFSGKNCPRLILPHWDKFINEIKKEMELIVLAAVKRYKNIKEMPEWMQVYVTKWVDKGYIKGNTTGELDFSEDMVRVLIIAERMMNNE